MGIIKAVEPAPKRHICSTPNPEPYGVGTIWECDTCGAVFVRNGGNFTDFNHERKRRNVLSGNGRFFWLQTQVAVAERKTEFRLKLAIYGGAALLLVAWLVFMISAAKH